MNTEQDIQQLLRAADAAAQSPPVISADRLIAAVRHQQSRHKTARRMLAGGLSAAAMVTIVCSVWAYQSAAKQQQIAGLQQDIDRLNRRVDSTLALVAETLKTQRDRETLAQLDAQLSVYDQSRRQFQEHEETAAMTLLLQAEQMQETNLTQGSQNYYNRVIRMYPDTPSAAMARQKLQQLKNSQETLMKGNML